MNSLHYSAAGYNENPPPDLPNIPDERLLHMNDDDIRTSVLKATEVGPPQDVPEDMGRANFSPIMGQTTEEIDPDILEAHINELIQQRDRLIAVRRERNRISNTLGKAA